MSRSTDIRAGSMDPGGSPQLDDVTTPAPTQSAPSQPGGVAFAAVYADHADYVWGLVRRLGVTEKDSQDVMQDVFMVVFKKRADYDPRRPMRPWLCGIAHRVVSDWRRRAVHRRERDMEGIAEPASDHMSPHQAFERRGAKEIVHTVLATLPTDLRDVFVMVELEGMSAPDVSGVLGIPSGTVYSRLHTARAAFTRQARTFMEGGAS